MCQLCGQIWCSVRCPAYDPATDPSVTGWCDECGVPLYREGAVRCRQCEKEERDGNQ